MSDLKDAVLKAVDGADGHVSSMDLAARLQVTHNEVVGVIKSLQAIDAQLLGVADRKIVKFVPTDEGESFVTCARVACLCACVPRVCGTRTASDVCLL
jgi:hypothetical protein